MGAQLLFCLLGASLVFPRAGALTCYKGLTLRFGQNMRQQPQYLTTENNITCEEERACQETVLFTESGTRGILVGSKGCAESSIASSGPTTLAAPGVTILSYTRVCSSDLCNDISSTASILQLAPPAAPSPDGLQCPTCVTLGSSCSNPALSLCPNGTSRCYEGQFQLSGGGISSPLSIQGCAPKAITSCRLLRNTTAFGPIAVTEACQEVSNTATAKPYNKDSATTVQTWGMGAGLLLALWGALSLL